MVITPFSVAPRRGVGLALLLAALVVGGSVTAAKSTVFALASHTGFSVACSSQDHVLVGFSIRNERHLVSMQAHCASLTADGRWNGGTYTQPVIGGAGAGLEPLMCPRDSVVRSVLVFEDSAVPAGNLMATAVTRIALVCTDVQNRDTRVGSDAAPGTFTAQLNRDCPPGQRVADFQANWGTQNVNLAPNLQVMREIINVACSALPIPRQPEPLPQPPQPEPLPVPPGAQQPVPQPQGEQVCIIGPQGNRLCIGGGGINFGFGN